MKKILAILFIGMVFFSGCIIWDVNGAGNESINNETNEENESGNTMCIDQDSGLNIYEKAVVSKGSVTHEDYCEGITKIIEYVCIDNKIVETGVNCPQNHECEDGKCVAFCSSEFDGVTPTLQNKVIYRGDTYEDYCINSWTAVKYACGRNELEEKAMICESPNQYCYEGACIPESCTDSDYGYDEYTKGFVEYFDGEITIYNDKCDGDYLTEYACSGNKYTSAKITCPKECLNGRCVGTRCVEGDYGKDVFNASYVRVGNEKMEDYCIDEFTVREYYCKNDKAEYEDMKCYIGHICSEGICTEVDCYDSDGGRNYYEKGITINEKGNKEDYCSDERLAEFYCEDGERKVEWIIPGEGEHCENGRLRK